MSNYVESYVLIVTFHKYLEYLACLKEKFENAWYLATFIVQSIPAVNLIFFKWYMMFTVGYIKDILRHKQLQLENMALLWYYTKAVSKS